MTMTSEAKRRLSGTIRELRAYLIEKLDGDLEGAYRFRIKRAQDAGLDEATTARRKRFEGWIAEQVRAEGQRKGKGARTAEDFRREAVEQAAYTLLNRLVFLKLLEAPGPDGTPLRSPKVVTGGWDSRGYRDYRELAPALVEDDPSEGYDFLLRLVFQDLAHDLPGLYGPAGIAELLPIAPAVWRRVIEALDDPALESCWTDDMTLGWVYQYWNDPERERLDAKLNAGGKVEPHEIASKTQMFTERYMVDWLLQNSLGPMWLAICQKHGWTPEVESDGTLARLEARRAEWRDKREAGEVELKALMPLETEMERRWAYYVPQPIPDDAVTQAPETVRDLRLLDPAVGSGHFLVVAFDLLFALYKEEARHRSQERDERWSDAAITARILEHNLAGVDLDPRAVQIAAAALWLKAKHRCRAAEIRSMNLVASKLSLASLPDDDPALVELRAAVERETGIPARLTDSIVSALKGADHLGSLLKIDRAVDDAIAQHEAAQPRQLELGADLPLPRAGGGRGVGPARAFEATGARKSIVAQLEAFLAKQSRADDLGLRLRGEQLARGIRFLRLLQEGSFDLVVGNPPYQGTSKMADAKYVTEHYPLGKADLYAAFLLRGLELVREGGVSALLTMRNWMFIKQYAALRQELLEKYDLRALGDLAIGAFDEVPNDVLTVAISVFAKRRPIDVRSVAAQPTPPDDRSYDRERTKRKRAATLCQVGRHEFDPAALKVVPEWPLVYWWSEKFLATYLSASKVGEIAPARSGAQTSNDTRYLRRPWEVPLSRIVIAEFDQPVNQYRTDWAPYIPGAKGLRWIDPLAAIVAWGSNGLDVKLFNEFLYRSHSRTVKNEDFYFVPGVAFSTIGNDFGARRHRFRSVFGTKGASVFPASSRQVSHLLCLLNSGAAARVVEALNPGIDFTSGDVNRLPLLPVDENERIVGRLQVAFQMYEAHSEVSVCFRRPGPSPWRYAQDWAQRAVDRPEGAPLPPYEPEYDPEPATDHLSFALGVALGRFGANGEGILDPATADLSSALPAGTLFLDGTLDENDLCDGLGHPAAQPLHQAWAQHGASIDPKTDLRTYLRTKFFSDVHRKMYENRPVHWPLSSEKKTFVAWINIHRWDGQTLRALLAEHLHAAQLRLDGELTDLRAARDGADKKAARAAERRLENVLKWREELSSFIALVSQCAEKGAPPTDPKCTPREVDARYIPDLDDGVMINSAALWPLLEPQWKDPKKWWKELSTAQGKKDYDWSHLAMRYWPTRVDAKCVEDPSLGVAHGSFWRYHPARAWAWELRLQDEIGPDFRIDEAPYDPPGLATGPTGDPGSDAHRAAYLEAHPKDALAAVEKEALRRLRNARKKEDDAPLLRELRLLEPGLWSTLPAECWDLELRLSEKQGAELRLLALDEPEARAAFEAAHPEAVKEREHRLENLKPAQLDLAPDLAPDEEPTLDSGDEEESE